MKDYHLKKTVCLDAENDVLYQSGYLEGLEYTLKLFNDTGFEDKHEIKAYLKKVYRDLLRDYPWTVS